METSAMISSIVSQDALKIGRAVLSWQENAEVITQKVTNAKARAYIEEAILNSGMFNLIISSLYDEKEKPLNSYAVSVIKKAKNEISGNYSAPSDDKIQFKQQTAELFNILMHLSMIDKTVETDEMLKRLFIAIGSYSIAITNNIKELKKLDDASQL